MTMLVTRRKALIAFAAAGTAVPMTLSTATVAKAQTATAQGGDQGDYVQQTLMLGTLSLQTSQIAAEKAQNPMVQEFAQLEVGEQMAVASILAATEAGANPPALSEDRAAMVQQLTDLEAGAEFDAAYVGGQISGHQELLAVQQSISGSSEATVEAITARLSEHAIASHLAMLGHIQRMLGGDPAAGGQQQQQQQQQPAQGEAAPAEGQPAPAEGQAAPAEGGAAPAEGGAAPAEGQPAPAEGGGAPAEGQQPVGDAQPNNG